MISNLSHVLYENYNPLFEQEYMKIIYIIAFQPGAIFPSREHLTMSGDFFLAVRSWGGGY